MGTVAGGKEVGEVGEGEGGNGGAGTGEVRDCATVLRTVEEGHAGGERAAHPVTVGQGAVTHKPLSTHKHQGQLKPRLPVVQYWRNGVSVILN